MEGILPVYKPAGITSYDVIRIIKKMGVVKKIGHGGTLDPFAEGLLLILLGRGGTKQFDALRKLKKTYLATAVVGASSDTLDCTGVISMSDDQSLRASERQMVSKLKEVIPRFIGEIEQVVPQYSAAKVAGKPRYKYAREGINTPQTKKKVTIYDLKLSGVDGNQVTFETTVSSGTYIRQLSYDILNECGVLSYLSKLVRTSIGEIELKDACSIEELTTQSWQAKLRSLPHQLDCLG